jgi:hypothetical protein
MQVKKGGKTKNQKKILAPILFGSNFASLNRSQG